MSTIEQPQQRQGILSWLTNLTLNNTTTEQPTPQQNDENNHSYPNDTTADTEYNTDGNSINSKKSSTPSIFSRHFKNHLMHFHRPHGLFHQQSSHHGRGYKKQEKQQRQQRPSGSSNDADDEHDGGDSDSMRSRDGTQRPPWMFPTITPITTEGDTHEEDDDIEPRSSRENSIFSLPGDIDGPQVGFKKLKRDGDLVDYDDISAIEEDEEFQDNHYLEIRARSRSIIRNDLIGLAFNGPFQSPIQTDGKKKVLHVGCGNGEWCAQVAQLFPHWLVVGIDDMTGGPMQDQRKVPKNFKYIRCYYDVLKTLKDLPSNSFDLILCRFMIFIYPEEKYKELINEIKRICKPGGFAEFNELDMRVYGNPKAGPMTHTLNARVFGAMEANNLNPRLARKLGNLVSDVFTCNQSDSPTSKKEKKKYFNANYTSLPMGVWGGRLGVMFRDDINDLLEYFQAHSSDQVASDMSNSETEGTHELNFEEIETMEEEIECQKSFMNLHHVYARKSE